MELSALQIVTTVVLIVAAGAVALFCDYLRNRSQQLHELAVELNVPEAMSGSAALPLMRPSAASASAARIARTAPSPPRRFPMKLPLQLPSFRLLRRRGRTVRNATPLKW